jgi:hypothetical protein
MGLSWLQSVHGTLLKINPLFRLVPTRLPWDAWNGSVNTVHAAICSPHPMRSVRRISAYVFSPYDDTTGNSFKTFRNGSCQQCRIQGGQRRLLPRASTSKGGTRIEKEGTTQVVNDLFLVDLVHYRVVCGTRGHRRWHLPPPTSTSLNPALVVSIGLIYLSHVLRDRLASCNVLARTEHMDCMRDINGANSTRLLPQPAATWWSWQAQAESNAALQADETRFAQTVFISFVHRISPVTSGDVKTFKARSHVMHISQVPLSLFIAMYFFMTICFFLFFFIQPFGLPNE